MKVRSATLVQTFKPIRVEIDLESGQEMDFLANAVRYLKKTYVISTDNGVLLDELEKAFTRL
jgi:hypothetical protein